MKNVILFCLLVSFIGSQAQSRNESSCTTHEFTSDAFTTSQISEMSSNRVKSFNDGVQNSNINGLNGTLAGSSYGGEFKTANVSNGLQSMVMLVRMNPQTNLFEIKVGNNKIYNLNKIENLSLSFSDSQETYKLLNYIDNEGLTKSDFFIFDSNKTNSKLLKKEHFKFVKARVATSSYGKDKPSTVKKSIQYYVKTANNQLVELSTNRKNIARAYAANSDELMAYMKSNKIKTNSESDLTKLATFISNLELNIHDTKGKLASNE